MQYMVACQSVSDERGARLDEVLAKLGRSSWKSQEGVWVIEADEPATVLRDRIRPSLEPGETVIVALLAGHAAWHGFEQAKSDWLLANL